MTMPLVIAAACGVLVGFLRAALQQRRLAIPKIRRLWLVGLSLLLALAVSRIGLPDPIASAAVLLSQGLSLAFAWLNHRQPGMWLLGLGLAFNLLVIGLNGGFMPISPETVQTLGFLPENWAVGQRLGMSKDLVLPVSDTHLWVFSDWLIPPIWFPWQGAFSIGDGIMGVGLFWVLWSAAGPTQKQTIKHRGKP